jgi:GH15 family glucan-1,4-alpha-glucosidase
MPRDLCLGNQSVGDRTSLHVNFRTDYAMGEIYFPQVGRENQTGGRPWRFGVWADGAFAWSTDASFRRVLRYRPETLVTDVSLDNDALELTFKCADAVDYHRDIYLRKVTIINRRASRRDARLFFHQNPFLKGSERQNTAVYDPVLRSVLCYRSDRWVLAGACRDNQHGVDHYAVGLKEVMGLEGVWRACETGRLGDIAVQHGSVDAAIELDLDLAPNETRIVYFYLCFGESEANVRDHHDRLIALGPERILERTSNFWRVWVTSHRHQFADLPDTLIALYRRSLLTVRTLTDNSGAVIAATDWDVASNIRENYSYCWTRDGALVANAMQRAGYEPPSTDFFGFCLRVLEREGRPYFMHKYNPDETVASTWLPRIAPDGELRLPIQEDETALVLWSLWEHYARFRQITHALREQVYRMVFPCADWICEFRSESLPKPSYDLWEERFGVHLYTAAAVYGALRAARDFAAVFAEESRLARYRQASDEVRDAIASRFWNEERGHLLRMLSVGPDGKLGTDSPDCFVVDSAATAAFQFGVLRADDPRLVATMEKIKAKLWVNTDVGGIARYERDTYQQVEHVDFARVPGNPWFICTLWLADWMIARARSRTELAAARELLMWVAKRALPSGLLAEQVDPYSGAPLSVSPLTWSHATFISTAESYLSAFGRLS